MNVGVVMPSLGVSGGVRRIVEVSNRLTVRGHTVTVYHPGGGPCDWLPFRARAARIAQIEGARHDAVIFVESTDQSWAAARSAWADRIVFYTLGMNPNHVLEPDLEDGRSLLFRELLTDERVGEIWVVATWMRDWLRDNFGVSARVMFGGVDQGIFHPRHGVRSEAPLILHSGDARPRKGEAVVRAAIELLRAKRPETKDETYHKRGLSQEELGLRYASATVFATAEVGWGWTNTVLEAMASGTPVACTDQPGVWDFAFDGQTALLCPTNEPVLLAANVARLLDDPVLARKLARGAYEMSRRFTWDKTADMVEAALCGPVIPNDRARAVAGAMSLPGKTREAELVCLHDLAVSAPPGPAVDLGTWHGRSAALLAAAGRQVWSVDDYREGLDARNADGRGKTSQAEVGLALKRLGLRGRVELVEGPTDAVPDRFVPPAALIFVDGGHTADQITRDVRCWAPQLHERGVIVFHDYGSPRWKEAARTIDRLMVGWTRVARADKLIAFRRGG